MTRTGGAVSQLSVQQARVELLRSCPMIMRAHVIALCLVLSSACGGTVPRTALPDERSSEAAEWETLLAAEDARLATPAQVELLRRGLEAESDVIRAAAVRGLGRSERAEFAPVITPLLHDPADSVRAAAAHALGNVSRASGAAEARRALLEALPAAGVEAAAAIVETLGRLSADSAEAHRVTARLVPYVRRDDATRLGALRGLYFLARQPPARPAVRTAAGALADVGLGRSTGTHPRERTLAFATLALVRGVDEATLASALQDVEPQVRREAAAAAAALGDTAAVRRITGSAAADDAAPVRYEAVRVHAARLGASHGCAPVQAAVRDRDVHVSLLAIGLLGTTCRGAAHASVLDSIAASAGTGHDQWHRAGHAAVSLAGIDAGRARVRAAALARHSSPFARTYAARAAAVAGDTALLHQLARDTSANVRTAAVAGLSATVGNAADSVFMAQLESDESELLMAASAALEGSSGAGAADRLIDALDRVSRLQRETSRDGRVALLERIQELGDASLADRIRPYLTDFDEAVADRAADLLQAWTGERPVPAPAPLPPLPLPTYDESAALARTAFVLEMAGGGNIEVQLLSFDAPTNAARFARLARTGYFDGRTIHRVVPNFVVQGGSPGANEYSGDGPFTRDELGVRNWRGTVGLSTRGRDTGDAQFYINLIDNVRLDHEYTVFGVVVRGMDVVDGVLEGAVIRRVREQPAR